MTHLAQALHDITVYANGILSQIFNGILIFVILKYSRTNMGSYKYLMIIFAAFEMFYSFVHVAVHPEYLLHKRMFIVFYNGFYVDSLSRFQQHIFVSWFAGSYCQALLILSYHFIYRYIAICKFNLGHLWSAPRWIAFWFFLYWAVTGTWFGMCIGLLEMRNVKDDLGYGEMMKNFNISIYERGYTGPLYYYDNKWVFTDCFGMGVVVVILFTCTVCIVSFAILIPRIVFNTDMSERTKSLQKQLFRVLMLQTIIPIVTSHTPIAIVFLGSAFGLEISIGHGVSALTTFFPVIDPLISLFFIKDYRNAILRFFCAGRKIMNFSRTAQSATQSNNPNSGVTSGATKPDKKEQT